MAFDANLVLHDGTAITASISPVDTTRTSGSAVIDLLSTYGVKGMAAVLIMAADLEAASDTLTITIEESAAYASGFVEIAAFPVLTYGTGMPGTYIVRFDAQKRYVRAKIVVHDDSGGGYTVVAYILLSQYPFKSL